MECGVVGFVPNVNVNVNCVGRASWVLQLRRLAGSGSVSPISCAMGGVARNVRKAACRVLFLAIIRIGKFSNPLE